MTICWLNGALVKAEDAKVSVFDHGLLYGDGVFEGMRFYKKQIFQLDAHLNRLFDSAASICLTIPYTRDALAMAIKETIASYPENDGYVRLVVTRGEGQLGIDPRLCVKPNTFIITDKLAMVSEKVMQEGARLIIASTRRLPVDGLDPRVKSLNYLNHILARIEANNAGADEAVLLNAQGFVTEGSADNIFIVKNNVLLTPPVSDGALAGITRQIVIELASQLDIICSQTSLSPYDLYTADECFLTGTAAELIPVKEIDSRFVQTCPGNVFQQLQQAFFKRVHADYDFAEVTR